MAILGYVLQNIFMYGNLFTNVFYTSDNIITPNNNNNNNNVSIGFPHNRTIFPPDFLFGAASSAYQVEGAWNVDGKGPSIWDTFTHEHPGKIVVNPNITTHSNGDVALDFYHRYKEDIKLAKDQGLDALRISIAWSRILPEGKRSKGINWAGIEFYNKVINESIAQGIKLSVTLFHWDAPQALQDEYLGFLRSDIVGDFVDYADVCFEYFGDRVKHWVTFNEPHTVAILGYDSGLYAPGRCTWWLGCKHGNSATEPYIVSHNQLLAHAAAIKLYRQKYQARQKGEIGLAVDSQWFEPYTNKIEDIEAAERALQFALGWYMNPVIYGDYPEVMRSIVKDRLPKFTEEEKRLLIGSFDFIGINYYTAHYAAKRSIQPIYKAASVDNHVNILYAKDGVPIGEPTGNKYFFVTPWGLENLLLYVKNKYNNPIVYVTENGYAEANVDNVEEGVNDIKRVDFHKAHFAAMHSAYEKGVNLKGYFAWAFHDNFEWTDGYTMRFGFNYIDYKDNLKRYPKQSALWLKKFLLK